MQQSKGYRRFKQRLDYFLIDHEVAEILVLNKELLKGSDTIFKKVDVKKHPLLSARTANANSRKLVVTHLRKTIYVSFIKDMYEEVTEYLRYILAEGVKNGADSCRIVGQQKITLQAAEILSLMQKNELAQTVVRRIFQDLDSKRNHTIKLIPEIINKLGLTGIDPKLVKAACPYLELRHVLVHDDGKPNNDFIRRYPQFAMGQKRIALNAQVIKDAYCAVNELLRTLDTEMIQKGYIPEHELQII